MKMTTWFKALALNALFFCLYSKATAQENTNVLCGFSCPRNTESFDNNTEMFVPATARLTNVTYAIHFTILRDITACDDPLEIDAYNMNIAKMKAAIDYINTEKYFAPLIRFVFGGAKFVINTTIPEFPDPSVPATQTSAPYMYDDKISNLGENVQAIHVFIVNTERSYAYPPKRGIGSPFKKITDQNFIILANKKIKPTVNSFERELAHELGHFFGLVHTHESTEPDPNNINGNPRNPEYQDGSNSDKSGDYLTDTPADPRANRCNYKACNTACTLKDTYNPKIQNPTDQKGYTPDKQNIMGYYYPDYRCGGPGFHFSAQQMKIMDGTKQNPYNSLGDGGITHQNRAVLANPSPVPSAVIDFHAGKILRAQCSNAPISEPVIGKNLSITVAGTII